MGKRRLDTLLVERGLAASDKGARALTMAGRVRVDGRMISKAGTLVDESGPLSVTESSRYVSRGGEKLEHAIRVFGLDVSGMIAADIGSSTGGFTDCLLQHGAAQVYAIDVGKGQLHYQLRGDERVTVLEGVNAREVESLPETVGLATVDVSFISLRAVLPGILRTLKPAREIVALLKPQFEAERGEVPRGGVIGDAKLHSTVIGRFVGWSASNAIRVLDLTASPILGAEGNREFFLHLRSAGK